MSLVSVAAPRKSAAGYPRRMAALCRDAATLRFMDREQVRREQAASHDLALGGGAQSLARTKRFREPQIPHHRSRPVVFRVVRVFRGS